MTGIPDHDLLLGDPSMTGRTLHVGFAGAGYIADWHARALRTVPGLDLLAVCDRDPSRAQGLSSRFAVDATYTDLSSMLAGQRLDAIHVLLPPDQHFAAALESLDAGVHVLLEKPMCLLEEECSVLEERARRNGCVLGVSHNFLHYPIYRQLKKDVAAGRLGRLDCITITWNKDLPQLRAGPFGSWMLQGSGNIILESGVHSVAHLVDLVGVPDSIEARADSPTELPNGVRFFRRWFVRASKGAICVELRFGFGPGFPEHSIELRGSAGTATVDFDNDVYTVRRHLRFEPDFDRYQRLVTEGRGLIRQARRNLARYCLSKFHLSDRGNPFAHSLSSSLASFYSRLTTKGEGSSEGDFSRTVVRTCNAICAAAGVEVSGRKQSPAGSQHRPAVSPAVLVLGGTGFIGASLVRQLLREGEAPRVLLRDVSKAPLAIREAGVDVLSGDCRNAGDLERALEGVRFVYHVARAANARTRSEYQQLDVEVTRNVAQACLRAGVEMLYYTSTIDCYYSGSRTVIDESTAIDPHIHRRNLYAQAKAASEKMLLEMHRLQGLPVVIFRPGIVIGRGSSPFHWGTAFWAWESICRLWGEGRRKLPIVLVDDVARALASARKVSGLAGESFNLVGDACLTACEYLEELQKALGTEFDVLPTPAWKLFLFDSFKWLVKLMVRHPERRLPSYRDWKTRSFVSTYDCSKAKKVLGWQPTSDRATVIRVGIVDAAHEWSLEH
jgi:predicted dehydrogenase/nucleoside-diphosphate-sugar epimerase